MKTISIISAVLTILMLFCTLVCGFWIGTQKVVEPSSILFHRNIAVATSILAALTSVLLIIQAVRR